MMSQPVHLRLGGSAALLELLSSPWARSFPVR
jgi:hypothetical protein